MKLVLASKNEKKLKEMAEILSALGIEVISVNQGASDTSVLIGIREKDAKEALAAVYEKLFG